MNDFVSNLPNTKPELIVEMELVILEAIDFRLPSFSAVVCFYGFIFDYLPKSEGLEASDDFIQEGLDRLQTALMLDSVMLVSTSSHIGLACALGTTDHSEIYWEERLQKLGNIGDLYANFNRIREAISNFAEVDQEALRPIDRKIRTIQSALKS